MVSRVGSLELTDIPPLPSLSQSMRFPVGVVLSLTLGHVKSLSHWEGKKEGEVVFSWVHCWLFPSHLPSALQGYKPGLAANPLLPFPFYFPPSLESWWIFHCWVFQEEKSLNDVLCSTSPQGCSPSRRNELLIRETAWGDTQLVVQQPKSKIWEIIYKSLLWQAKINPLQKLLCWCHISHNIAAWFKCVLGVSHHFSSWHCGESCHCFAAQTLLSPSSMD